MKTGVDTIGAMIFFDEEDEPEYGTIQVEHTDQNENEFGIFIKGKERDINIYVNFELWKTLYKMAMNELGLQPRYSEVGKP